MQPFDSVSVIENAAPLDRLVEPVRSGVRRVLGAGAVRDALRGEWLGHPVHPTLVQVSLGAFLSATVLDAVPGNERAARTLIAAGMVTVPAAAATGWADWSRMQRPQQRVGVVHAAVNVAGVAAYGASLASRLRGRPAQGKAWGVLGLGLLGLGGYLGGHLSFPRTAGADNTAGGLQGINPGWHDLCAVDDLAAEGEPASRTLLIPTGVLPVLVVRSGGHIDVRGSASASAAFDVRVEDGRVQVRLPQAD